jgi:hypothetical protein
MQRGSFVQAELKGQRSKTGSVAGGSVGRVLVLLMQERQIRAKRNQSLMMRRRYCVIVHPSCTLGSGSILPVDSSYVLREENRPFRRGVDIDHEFSASNNKFATCDGAFVAWFARDPRLRENQHGQSALLSG